ncbi:MAG TPA: M28 family peptidase [Planctomycetes bacterium]|nr:M28 family peptidase [Planctomycetota bacterium]
MMQKKTVKPIVFGSIATIGLAVLVVSLTFQTNGQSQGRNLTRRKNEIIRIIQERGDLDTKLRRRVMAARTAAELESLFEATEAAQLRRIPFDGQRCYQVLKDLCAMGSRRSGSEGMRKQREFLNRYFTQLGGKVQLQSFDIRHPVNGSRVTMHNMIVQWHPQRKKRVLLCAHYDTRPFPDRDPDPSKRRGVFLGANDGASGVALLCGLAHSMGELKGSYGVDFVFFDGEEFVFDAEVDPYFLGSTEFAQSYRNKPPSYQYRWGVLLDMVADEQLQIYQEINSWKYARPIVQDLWAVAKKLGVIEFRPQRKHEIRDDHLPLNEIALIPTCDIIDFDYPRPGLRTSYWHTQQDSVEHCSAVSLARVGWVVQEWLRQLN